MREKLKKLVDIVASGKWALISSILIFILLFNYLFSIELKVTPNFRFKQSLRSGELKQKSTNQVVQQNVIASEVRLPIKWADLGKKLIDTGVIDKNKFDDITGTLSEEDRKLVEDAGNGEIIMTEQNSRLILNLLWGFGLANKNDVLDKG